MENNPFELNGNNNAPPKPKVRRGCRIAAIVIVALAILIVLVPFLFFYFRFNYQDSMEEKYGGHGFEYMHGYSSTDFTGYHVYDGDKLVTLDSPSEMIIQGIENMPLLDGAEACYPLYAAIAKALYTDIDKIEAEALELISSNDQAKWNPGHDYLWDWEYCNGRIVTFTNTVHGYDRLVDGRVDLFFGARPSENVKQLAEYYHEEIQSIPIGREAFVFFVEEDNPVENLTSDQVRQIYSGEITNWKDVGGNDQKIVAFQRPAESGSQVMMRHFMGDIPLMEPDTYTVVDAMGGVIDEVKQYHNERGAIGYTFQYFLSGLNQEEGVKMLSIDGVYPSVQHIKDGTYPAIVSLVCAKLKSNNNPYVEILIDFLLSDQGQELVEKTGYGPLPRNQNNIPISEPITENNIDPGIIYELESEEHSATLLLAETVFELTYDDTFIKGTLLYDSESGVLETELETGGEPTVDSEATAYEYNLSCAPLSNYFTKYGLIEFSLDKDPSDGSLVVQYVNFDQYATWQFDIGEYTIESDNKIIEENFLKPGDRFTKTG